MMDIRMFYVTMETFILPALCQPNGIFFDGGRVAIHIENRLMRKLAKSESMWAASVMMARLLEK